LNVSIEEEKLVRCHRPLGFSPEIDKANLRRRVGAVQPAHGLTGYPA